MMVDSTAIAPATATKSQPHPEAPQDDTNALNMSKQEASPRDNTALLDKNSGRTRTKSNQRWMKLRTTVQLSGAITSTNQKAKPPLKREDSFLKRFSTRQIPETQETVDTGDETETHNGSQTQNEVNRRRRKRRKEMSKTVVNPDENFYFYWLMTVTVCVLYNLWTLIVRQCFPELQKAASAFWYSGDGFTDIVFLCDIMVQFRTGYLEQGLMVYNSRKLASHYFKSRAFVLDTMSLMPLDFLQLKVGVNPLLRFPRFLKVYRVYNYYYMVESRTVYPNLWRVVNLIHILLILAHWFGCFYYLLSEAEGFQGHWVYPHRPGDYATLTRKYLASLYWSTLTLTTIGDLPTPETNAESRGRSKAMTSSGQSEGIPRRGHKSRLLQFNSNYGYLFTIISYLIGVFIFATIVGQVGNVITNRNANRLEFERLLDGAKTYMRHHKVPGGMKRRVLRWYDYSWSRGRIQGGGDINTALGLLPDKLKTELALHVNLSVLKKVTIFQECQPEFLHDLVLKMKAYIFTPGDLICRKGEVAREMFIIADGILDVISETGRVLTTMKAGDFFGEIGILNLDGLNKRTADVRSVGYSELFSLSREDVLSAMKDYPEAQEILQSLGRKRLMEAKNASKMHKAQARQAKDHDSSGDSDTAGKRIVEKLRSDVKGLKKALRRSRRGTTATKHSILRRMSHVQSSDEFEPAVDAEQSPIGAGLPLLQRLKMLKEKQEREAEEIKNAKNLSGSPQQTKGERSAVEQTGTALVLRQKLKLLKHKEMKESLISGFGLVPSTVKTQVSGIQLDRSAARMTSSASPRDPEETPERRKNQEKGLTEQKGKLGQETVKIPLKERLKLIHLNQPKERSLSSRSIHEEGADDSSSKALLEPQLEKNETEEAGSSAGKSSLRVTEVGMSKDNWELLKKSSISCSESVRNATVKEGGGERKVSKKGTYLSKSDTVLERQKTIQKDEEKRSRSISPSNGSQSKESKGERRRSNSVGHSPKSEEDKHDLKLEELPNSSAWERGKIRGGRNSEEKRGKKIKKYNSISDLSPEYSGLPFVKKLKILNERQKLEELEKELVVRSMSLDVSEKPKTKCGNLLVRSQSEAAEYRSGTETYGYYRSGRRNLIDDDKTISRCSEGSIASPESNETLERRRLKSILKKLSAEDSTSDEDKALRTLQRGSSSRKGDSLELRKLMREPTLEGYAARHRKLTKSVTFDSDTLPSPLDGLLEQQLDEPSSRGYSPSSPTAILTLQLSNLSMMPIARPKNSTLADGQREKEQNVSADVQAKADGKGQEEVHDLTKLQNRQKQNLLPPFSEFPQQNAAVLPFTKSPQQQFFNEIEGEIVEIIKQLLEKAHSKFEAQLRSLRVEVKKRDEIIVHLQSKIQELENKNFQNEHGAHIVEKSAESSTSDSDSSGVPFPRGDSCETVWDAFDEALCRVGSPKKTDNPSKFTGSVTSSPLEDDLLHCITDLASHQQATDSWEAPADTAGRRRKPTADEVELREVAEPFRRRQRNVNAEEGYEEGGKGGSKGNFMNRLSQFRRSASSRDKNAGFIALEIEESSKSSDVENGDNKDWEVQMLVEELAKKDPYWKVEEKEWESAEEEAEHLEGVEKLREEVDTLKRVVCGSDLSRLTNSELDIIESIIEDKDQKILQLVKSTSLDYESKDEAQKRAKTVGPSGAQDKFTGQLKKSSLKHKIGQALSFDFHDMESRKAKVLKYGKHPKPQKIISGSHREHQSLYNLWRTSARLRNRMLDDSDRTAHKSTMPLLEKSSRVRSSLPLLSCRDSESVPSSSVRSLEEPLRERHLSPARDSERAETPNSNAPSTSGTVSLNSFIKSVGQKVKQVVVGDGNGVREQVPTISRLLEKQPSVRGAETEMSEGMEGLDEGSMGEDARPLESSKVYNSNTDLPDL